MKCFVIALMKEASPIVELLENRSERTVHSLKIITGTLYGEDVTILICGVGKVNAARGSQYAIDSLNADTIINIGTSGGLVDSLKIGEIYVVSKVVQYDFDLVQINGTPIGTLNEFSEPFLPLATTTNFESVVCATGDRFNDSEVDFQLIRSLECTVRDMELGAIAQVCIHSEVKLYSFKVISDIHGSSSTTDQYTLNVALCAKNLEHNLQKIMESIR